MSTILENIISRMPWERLMDSVIATDGCNPVIKAELRRRLKREAAMTKRLMEMVQEPLNSYADDTTQGRYQEAEEVLDAAFKAEAK